jgi:hypothetical protein
MLYLEFRAIRILNQLDILHQPLKDCGETAVPL